jgi:drug/metabolite transporter, DME family
MHTTFRTGRGGLWLIITASSLWGTVGIATQAIFSSDNTTSLFINLMRLLISAPILLYAAWRAVGPRLLRLRRRDLGLMMLNGALIAMSQAAYFASIRAAGVTVATLLAVAASPVAVTCLSVLLRLERPTRITAMAIVCAVIGAVLLVGLGTQETPGQDMLAGALFAIACAVTYACSLLCGRFLAADYHPSQVLAITMCAGTVVLLAVNLLAGFQPIHTLEGWLAVVYLGLVPTALAYWMIQAGLRTVSATTTSVVTLLEPLVAALLAWALFGERLGAAGILGAALLVGAILMLSRQPAPEPVTQPALESTM